MSYLTEAVSTATLEYETGSGGSGGGGSAGASYEYHLPHTKTIDLIGEEFAPKRSHNLSQPQSVVVESIGANGMPISTTAGGGSSLGPNVVLVNTSGSGVQVPFQVQQIIQQAQQQVSMGGNMGNNLVSVALAPNHQIMGSSSGGTPQLLQTGPSGSQTLTLAPLPPSAVVSSSGSTLVIQQPHEHMTTATLPLTPVTVDLPTIPTSGGIHTPGGVAQAAEESGVLLCNLDELSRYIPENFYSDFTMADQSAVPDYLQTVVAGKAITTTVSAAGSHSSNGGSNLLGQTHTFQLPVSAMPMSVSQAVTTVTQAMSAAPMPQPITIQLPTQPQPIQGVKTVTYVNNVMGKTHTTTVPTSSFQPVKLTTQFAYTSTGERITIQGLPPEATKPGSTVQVQVKGGGTQTLQLQGLTVDPSKLTVLQELPEVGKVVIQEAKQHGSDSISSILEEMKTDEALASGNIEYATAIPVAVTSLASDPKKTTFKRVAAPASTVILPGNKRSRNIIFAGNTLPQGAIPIQINGLNALPISAVKSLPFNLSTLTPTSAPIITTNAVSQMVAAKKTKVEIVTSRQPTTIMSQIPANLVTKVTNNNTQQTIQQQLQKVTPVSIGGQQTQRSPISLTNQATLAKPVGNNKTCNWVFENGEVCGKTFSKSYNLVVHMRMHEDVRPFGCSLCDQTFRQKAHLQRHETTHGIGVKAARSSGSSPKRKRKRSRGSTGTITMQSLTPLTQGTVIVTTAPPSNPPPMSANLQQRLARVSEKFGTSAAKEDEESDEEDLTVNQSGGPGAIKSYSKRKLSTTDLHDKHDGEMEDDEDDLDGDMHTRSKIRRMSLRLDDGHHQPSNEGQDFQSSFVDVQDEVANLSDEDIIEHVNAAPNGASTMSHPSSRGMQVSSNSVIDAVAAAVSEAVSHTIPMEVTVTSTAGKITLVQAKPVMSSRGHESVVINAPEIQKEILTALLQHTDDPASVEQISLQVSTGAGEEESNHSNDSGNVKVEAQPTHTNMSPETLTAISGHTSPQPHLDDTPDGQGLKGQ